MKQDARIALVFLLVTLALVAVATWEIAGAIGQDRDIGFRDGEVVFVAREPIWLRAGGGEGGARGSGTVVAQDPAAAAEAAVQAKRVALRAAKARATSSFQTATGAVAPSSPPAASPLTPERAPSAAAPGPAIAVPNSSSISSYPATRTGEKTSSPTLQTPMRRTPRP